MANHAIMGGKVHLYQRPDSSYWWCSAFLEGKKRRKSTKTDSLAQAKDFAEDWYLSLRDLKRRGELLSEKTFSQAAEQFLKEYEVGGKNTTGSPEKKLYLSFTLPGTPG